jgi:hypothetical protein
MVANRMKLHTICTFPAGSTVHDQNDQDPRARLRASLHGQLLSVSTGSCHMANVANRWLKKLPPHRYACKSNSTIESGKDLASWIGHCEEAKLTINQTSISGDEELVGERMPPSQMNAKQLQHDGRPPSSSQDRSSIKSHHKIAGLLPHTAIPTR